MLRAIGTAVRADRTLGGLCDWVQADAPSTDDAEATGSLPVRFGPRTVRACISRSAKSTSAKSTMVGIDTVMQDVS